MTNHSKAATLLFSTSFALAGGVAAGGETVFDWNEVAQQHIAGPPFSQVRQYAMVHIAMADAVASIEGRYEPFHVKTWAPSGASSEAAAAQAAHDVLVHLVPTAASALAVALEESLAGISPGRRASGVEVGGNVAAEVIAWRADDGFADANPQPPAFLPSTLPGIWRSTASGPAQFSAWGDADPFGLITPTQYLPMPPPQLEDEEYAEDFVEVKDKGRAEGSTRLPEETQAAQTWAGVGDFANVTNPFRLWSNVAREVAENDELLLVEAARLFALMTASIHDSLQSSMASKFVYRLWRPETAIAHADIDENPGTEAEAGWAPLLGTPPYPSHVSNMACIGAGAARALANVFDADAKSFTATWYTAEGAVVHTQPYESFWALAENEGDSRIWAGIHFRFEIDASQESCSAIADYIVANRMRPL